VLRKEAAAAVATSQILVQRVWNTLEIGLPVDPKDLASLARKLRYVAGGLETMGRLSA